MVTCGRFACLCVCVAVCACVCMFFLYICVFLCVCRMLSRCPCLLLRCDSAVSLSCCAPTDVAHLGCSVHGCICACVCIALCSVVCVSCVPVVADIRSSHSTVPRFAHWIPSRGVWWPSSNIARLSWSPSVPVCEWCCSPLLVDVHAHEWENQERFLSCASR
jgi:hypothetical protein